MRNHAVKPSGSFRTKMNRNFIHLLLGALVIPLAGCLGLLGAGISPSPTPQPEHPGMAKGVVSYALHASAEIGSTKSLVQPPVADSADTPTYPSDFSASFDESETAELVLHLSSVRAAETVPESVQALLSELDGTVVRWLRGQNSLVVQLPEDSDLDLAVAMFERLPDVLVAEPNRIIVPLQLPTLVPNDPDLSQQWHLNYIYMPEAWAVEYGRSDIIIAVLDTGYSQHPDLPQEGDPRLVYPHSVFSDADYLDDGSGHGTAVAGVAAALTNNGAHGAGVAWRVSIMPVRVLRTNSAGKETGTEADVSDGIKWAVDHGAHVINLSFGYPRNSKVSHTMREALDYAIERGVTVVASAGNDGNRYPVVSPASHPGVIAVGAIAQNGAVAGFSNSGNRSGGNSLDLIAPGTNIYTTVSQPSALTKHTLRSFNGTSFASPQVSGVVALLYARGTLSRNMGAAAPALAQTILRETATPLEAGKAYDDAWGYGLLDAYAAITWDTRPRLDQVRVFAAATGLNGLQVLSDMAQPDRYGTFTLTNIPAGLHTLIAWSDTDRNGRINPGDFIGRLDDVMITDDEPIAGLHFYLRPTDLHMAVVH